MKTPRHYYISPCLQHCASRRGAVDYVRQTKVSQSPLESVVAGREARIFREGRKF